MVDPRPKRRLDRGMQVYVSKDGQQYGPYTVEQLREYLAQGSFVPTDFACQAGSTEWITVEQILQAPAPTATASVPSPQVTTTRTSNPQQQQKKLQKRASQHVQVAPAPKTKSRSVILWISIGSAVVAILTVTIFLISGSDEEEGFYTEWLGAVKYGEGRAKTGKNPRRYKDHIALGDTKIGAWTYFHSNGLKSRQTNYKDGKRDGLETHWSENGQKRKEANYKDDILIRTTEFYENGQKKEEINYKDGKKNGLVTEWYENGQKQSEANYKDDKYDGLYTWWYENGQKREESNWRDDKQDGLETDWNKNGWKELEANYKDDILIRTTEFYENGQKKEEINYKDGKKNGLVTEWYENGQKSSETNFKDGKGMSIESWWENGQNTVLGETKFKDGEIDGLSIGLREDGSLSYIKAYDTGTERNLTELDLVTLFASGTLKYKTTDNDFLGAQIFKVFAQETGSDSAHFNLGVMYEDGSVLEKNTKEALGHYLASAKKKNADSWYRMGLLLFTEKDNALLDLIPPNYLQWQGSQKISNPVVAGLLFADIARSLNSRLGRKGLELPGSEIINLKAFEPLKLSILRTLGE